MLPSLLSHCREKSNAKVKGFWSRLWPEATCERPCLSDRRPKAWGPRDWPQHHASHPPHMSLGNPLDFSEPLFYL